MSWAKEASDIIRAQQIPHPKFRQAESEALAALLTADAGEVVCIVGPSRVGKSHLVSRIGKVLIGDQPGGDSMPLVSITLENNSTHGSLSSKSFTVAALQAVRHPMFGLEKPGDVWSVERMRLVERTPEGVLRTAFENALRFRGTRYVVVDEAHHLLYARGGVTAAAALLDSLKCLAANTKVVLILVGAYPLLSLLLQSPHLIGRKLQTHFPRYRADVKADVLAFDRILVEYSKSLRFSGSQSLRDWNAYLHEGSLGCLGLARAWIRDALNQAWLRADPTLRVDHFEASRKSASDLQSLISEINAGEDLIRPTDLSVSQSRRDSVTPQVEAPKKRRRPFTANPRRFGVRERRSPHGK
jgi:energy-coupling factor transporter ATP-binding protein EcfA2